MSRMVSPDCKEWLKAQDTDPAETNGGQVFLVPSADDKTWWKMAADEAVG